MIVHPVTQLAAALLVAASASWWWSCAVLAIAPKRIQIGAIFDGHNSDAEMAFRRAIAHENRQADSPNVRRLEFVPLVRYVKASDSWLAEQAACALAADGVAAIFGPETAETSNIVASVCAELGLPHIIAHPQPPTDTPHSTRPHPYTRNFYPSAQLYAGALADIVASYHWPTFTLIYQHPASLARLHAVLQLPAAENAAPVTVRQLSTSGDDRADMSLLKSVHAAGTRHVVLDCDTERLPAVLQQAQRVRLLEEYQHLLILTSDAHRMDFNGIWPPAPNRQLRANVTTVRLMAADAPATAAAVLEWNDATEDDVYDEQRVPSAAALWHDAVHAFAVALREFDAAQLPVRVATNLRCAGEPVDRWELGAQIVRYMGLKTEHGVTGRIVFDDDSDDIDVDDAAAAAAAAAADDAAAATVALGAGDRVDFLVEVVELTGDNCFRPIASWTPTAGVSLTRNATEVYERITYSLRDKIVVVAARIGEPYLKLREQPANSTTPLTGNDRYEGYSMDLIAEIARSLQFRFRFELVADNAYGSFNRHTKRWDGLVKELLERRADLAICDLTITFERRRVVDFTMPFMTLGVSILYTKPHKEEPQLFQFLKPLAVDVWICMATAFLCVACVQFGLARLAADDWENPNPGDPEPEQLESIWSLPNCIWLAAGSVLQQGCDLMPKAASTRIVCGLWWFFTLIVIQSYTANLAAVLTKDRTEVTIESAEDLASQSKIKYGAVIGGSTLGFFKESNASTYQRMWSTMEANAAAVLVTSNREGEERVAKGMGSYAFLMESSSIEHICNRNCNLTQVGGQLDSKGYGIALPMNSPYRTHVSQALLKLQEAGKLAELKQRWWQNAEGQCPPDVESSDEMDVRRLGGVFLLLVAGIGIGIAIGVVEFVWHVRQVAIRQKVSMCVSMRQAVLFVLDVRRTQQPSEWTAEERTDDGDEVHSERTYEADGWR